MSVILGELATVSVELFNEAGVLADPSTIALTMTDPQGVQSEPSVAHDGVGVYHAEVPMDATGIWRGRWDTTGIVAPGEFTIECESITEGGVTDIRDLRVLIPACRRAIDGPMAIAPDSPSTTIDDRGVVSLLADATAELILFTQGESAFGYQLIPTARDPFYMAPVAWATDVVRDPAADAAILSQAALDHYYWTVKLLKVSETMKNEAVDWEYSLSANVIAAWIAYLIGNRDKAIAALQVINAPMDAYISTVAERDRITAAFLEPWVAEIGAPVPYAGGGGSGPLEYDFRFGTYG